MKENKRAVNDLSPSEPKATPKTPELSGDVTDIKISGRPASEMPIGLVGDFARQTPTICFIKDQTGRYIFCNERFEETFNLKPGQLVGKKDDSWLPAESAQRIMANDRAVFVEAAPMEVLETVALPDGANHEYLVWKFPCTAENGEVVLGGVAFDVTKLQQSGQHLRGQSELLELILNNIGDPVVAVDASGKLLLFNPAAIRLYGMGIVGNSQTRPSDRYGLFLPDGVNPYPKEDLPLARAIRGETVLDLEIFVRTPDAPDGAFLSAKAQPILDVDGNLKGAAAVFRDITSRKRAEEDLQQMVRQLQEARDEAIQASELKSQFVANISHELRTPMSGVLGMTELLLAMSLEPEQKELATYIYESAQSLLLVVNELLDFSRLEAGKLVLERTIFDAGQAVDDVIGAVQLAVARKGLRLTSHIDDDVPANLCGDLRRIKQVLQHIVHNAIKFTEKGTIEVSVSVDRSLDDVAFIRFKVKDTGIGIPDLAMRNVFAPFVQVDGSTTRKYGGVGLGLSISKRLVKLMQGNLAVESKEAEGSTFWFSVPLEFSDSTTCKEMATN
jgi:signal transduction histidine kinase